MKPYRLILTTIAVASMFPFPSLANNQTKRAPLAASRPVPMQLVTRTYRGTLNQPMNQAAIGSLREAYRLLHHADHDYQGHRIKAMHAIHAAGQLMGVDLRGDGKAHEQQTISDAQLRQAQSILQQMRDTAGAGGQRHQRVLGHIDHAISELSTALSIK